MQLKFQDSLNPAVFITTPEVGGTGVNLIAANHPALTQKLWVVNEQWQAFAGVVRLGQKRVPHTWLRNTDPGGYDNCSSDLHQHSAVAQMRVLHVMISQPNIANSMIHRVLEACEDHTMRLTENGDTLQSDELFILEC